MHPSESSLIVVSNRLPVSISQNGKEWEITPSSGGLASAMRGVKSHMSFKWIGWPGGSFFKNQISDIESQLKEQDLIPVFLDKEEEEHYYHNVCNSYLWPIFHYFTEQVMHASDSWRFYEKINERFAQTVISNAPQGATIWVHDFHLMLLPSLLREQRSDLKIGFFLHIPFPSSEIYRMIPNRKQLLEGLLGCDYIGFHTMDYARHFRTSCQRILGLSSVRGHIYYGSRKIGVGVHPIGMNVDAFRSTLDKPKYFNYIQEIKERYTSHQVIFGVERLDYTKGIFFKLQAFEQLLEDHPELIGKVILLQVIVPCRHDSPEYQKHRAEIEKMVSRINGKFSKPGFNPVHYMYRSLPISELIALYCLADTCMVTSIRDGMNLVAQEFVYCAHKANSKGVLVLSEFAGASHHMPHALLINPFDIPSTAKTLYEALGLDEEQRKERLAKMSEIIEHLDSPKWAKIFLEKMHASSTFKSSLRNSLDSKNEDQLVEKAQNAQERFILLDYDGTLREITSHPLEAAPTPEILKLLKELSTLQSTQVHLISGRDAPTLQSWFGGLNLHLSAEHGFTSLAPNDTQWTPLLEVDLSWKPYVKTLLEKAVEEVPGSFLEIKNSVLCWHYRLADSDYGGWRANELYTTLVQELANLPVEITSGKCVLEVRAQGISKGKYVQKVLQGTSKEAFILCIGDDKTDQEMYQALPEHAISIHVGSSNEPTTYEINSPKEVRDLLNKIKEMVGVKSEENALDE